MVVPDIEKGGTRWNVSFKRHVMISVSKDYRLLNPNFGVYEDSDISLEVG